MYTHVAHILMADLYTYGQGISKPTQRGGGRGRSEGEVEGGVDERGREGGVDEGEVEGGVDERGREGGVDEGEVDERERWMRGRGG